MLRWYEFRISDAFGNSQIQPVQADSEEEALQSIDFHFPYAEDIKLVAVRGKRLRSLEALSYDD